MIRILHCADLHLDSPFRSLGVSEAAVRRRELRGTFTSLMMYIRENGVKLCLMAGDLFDSELVTSETMRLLAEGMASAPDCRFVIAPGNHDPYTPTGVWARTALPENAYLFTSPEIGCFSFDDIGVDVYGYAFPSSSLRACPIGSLRPKNPDRINLLVMHADLESPLSVYAPVRLSEIEASGMDYAALGHVHQTDGVKKAGGTYYAYAGCIEGRDFGETGHKGAFVCDLSKENGVLSASFRGVPFSKRRYEVDTLSVDGCGDEESVAKKIHALMHEKKYFSDTALRLTLTGLLPPSFRLRTHAFEEAFRGTVFSLELIDRTRPLLDAQTLTQDPTLKGEFCRTLLPALESGDEKEAGLAALALRLGLDALEGEDLSE